MGLGQTMLSAGFLVLMIMITISANRMLMESSQTAYEAESVNIAADLANALMTEATRKKFDEGQANYGTQLTNAFTLPSGFGPLDAGEAFSPVPDVAPFKSITYFDDIDDYHGYVRNVDGQSLKGFVITAQVNYVVSRTNPNQNTTSRTLLKRIDVTVTHPLYIPIDSTHSGLTLTRILTF